MSLEKKDVVETLEELATLLELKGENPFRIRAFQNAARRLQGVDEDIKDLVETKSLQSIKGIGKNLAGLIEEMVRTEKEPELLQELKSEFPSEFLACLKVPGLGAKKLGQLRLELGIDSLRSLEAACRERKLVRLKGFGEKTQQKILKGIEYLERNVGKRLYADIENTALELLKRIRTLKGVEQAGFTGAFRRKMPVVDRIEILMSSEDGKKVFADIKKQKEVTSVEKQTKTGMEVLWGGDVIAEFRVAKPAEYSTALFETTGSRKFLESVGAQRKKADFKSEEEVFESLGLAFLPPEYRETGEEVKENVSNLLALKDLQGFFHMHSTYSDGRNTLEEMVSACAEKGFKYIGVSDHSQSAGYANGLKETDIDRQHKEIDRLQKKFKGMRILKGIESDILKDGSLDYPERVLKKFNFVIGSVHSSFQLNEEEMTERCTKALENPYCTILGHPTGRLLTVRDGFEIDLEALLDAAKRNEKILELNCNPYRLDLDWTVVRQARKKGIPISVNPDAHSLEGIDHLRFGVWMARKAGLSPKNVFNARPLSEVLEYLGAG